MANGVYFGNIGFLGQTVLPPDLCAIVPLQDHPFLRLPLELIQRDACAGLEQKDVDRAILKWERTFQAGIAGRTTEGAARNAHEWTLFGPIGRERYYEYALYLLEMGERGGRNPLDVKFGRNDSNECTERRRYWQNFETLCRRIDDYSGDDIVGLVRDVTREFGAQIDLEPSPRDALEKHLRDVEAYARHFLDGGAGQSRFPELLTDHQVALFTDVIAPLHDTLKFLSAFPGQIMSDHEVVTRAFVRDRCLVNRSDAVGNTSP